MVVDIFRVRIARNFRNDWKRYVSVLYGRNLLDESHFVFVTINSLVQDGFLSPVSASYFLTGKSSPAQNRILENFLKIYQSTIDGTGFNFSKIYQKWLDSTHAQDAEVNTFLFPLEELDSEALTDSLFSMDPPLVNTRPIEDLKWLFEEDLPE